MKTHLFIFKSKVNDVSDLLVQAFFYNITWYLRHGKVLPDLEFFA